MGKKGAELRAKKDSATITFTKAQLVEHDKQVIREWQKRSKQYMNHLAMEQAAGAKEVFVEETNKYFAQKAETFKSGNWLNDFSNAVSFAFAIPVKVLVEQFGWEPLNGSKQDNHKRIARFSKAMVREFGEMTESRGIDIEQYAKDVEKKYGISFSPGDV